MHGRLQLSCQAPISGRSAVMATLTKWNFNEEIFVFLLLLFVCLFFHCSSFLLFLWLSPSAGNYVYLFTPWCCAPILSCTPCHLFKYSSVLRYKVFALSVITGFDWQVFMKSWLHSVEFIYCIYVTPGRINTFRIIDGGLKLHHLSLILFLKVISRCDSCVFFINPHL